MKVLGSTFVPLKDCRSKNKKVNIKSNPCSDITGRGPGLPVDAESGLTSLQYRLEIFYVTSRTETIVNAKSM